MARARLIAASLGSSRKFHALQSSAQFPEFAQLLFVLLVPNSDDFGRMKGDAFTVKFRIFPGSTRPEAEFERALDDLAGVGLIDRYTVDGEIFLQVNKFEDHQQNLHKRTSSKFPESPGMSGAREENGTERKGTEGKGREGFPEIPGTVPDTSDQDEEEQAAQERLSRNPNAQVIAEMRTLRQPRGRL